MRRKYLLPMLIILAVLGTGSYLIFNSNKASAPVSISNNTVANSSTPATANNTTTPTPPPEISPYGLAYPIADFKARITKKPFGIHITPANSPVQPERFSGYHNADDVEYQDIIADVSVYALADGKIVLSRTASGYGGIFMIEFDLNGTKHTALYGHIRPSSLPKLGSTVTKGQQLAVLGTAYSTETDGERRHLHFAVLADNSLNLAGYVSTKTALSGWLDPLSLYN